MVDLDAEEESPFLRGQKRVPVRLGAIPRKTAKRLKYAVLGALSVLPIFTGDDPRMLETDVRLFERHSRVEDTGRGETIPLGVR